MLVTWRYRERNTIIQRLDPRARIIFMLCALLSIYQIWNLPLVLFFFVLAIAQLWLARLTWQEMRRFWLIMLFIITILSLATALTGRGGINIYTETYPYPLWQTEFQLFGATYTFSISVERFTFLVTQIIRFFSFAALAVPIPFTIHPARYGITFRRLGVPDKFAFATDLAFRFIPSLGQDFQMILDAQRARGYELERIGGGLVQQIRNMAPLLIPLIVGSIIRSEEIIDAMDLRGFGTRPRTWLEELRYTRLDYALIVFSVVLLVGSTALNWLGYDHFWVPPFLLDIARRQG
ncbi:MAG: energy-coupling factor transporter transmembrane protein EcfT [Chloroflexi bacterium]|nr:energy-coupling factor transporter transmembrane protein EcfT [Chloroflexota bacterium]